MQFILLSSILNISDENNIECLKVMEYKNLHGMQHLEFENFLNITWKPQNDLNSLAIEYVFCTNALYSIIIYIFDENDVQLYFSDVIRGVSIKLKILRSILCIKLVLLFIIICF